MSELKIFKVHPEVSLPGYATTGSACFDLSYQPHGKTHAEGYDRVNRPFTRNIDSKIGKLTIAGGERMLVPTGLIFDLPEGHSLRLHPRSGLSLKKGITLINAEGVVDEDYYHETFILLWNTTDINFDLVPGDRIAQAELCPSEQLKFLESKERPEQKTDRAGGFGSTDSAPKKTKKSA